MNKSKPTNRKFIYIGIGILAVLAILAGIYFNSAGNKPSLAALPLEVSVKEAAAMKDAGSFILDVRQPEEWNQGHISGALLIPLGDLSARLSELPTDKDIVVVCRSGNRSAQARDILRNAGLSRTTSMAGGMNEWVSNGYPAMTGP